MPVFTPAPNCVFLLPGRPWQGGCILHSAAHTAQLSLLPFDSYASFEHHALSIMVYRPPQYSTSFISEFSEFLSINHATYNRILVTGGFNPHTDNTSNPVSKECLDFKPHVIQLTHNSGHILFITYDLSMVVSSGVDLAVSDHQF